MIRWSPVAPALHHILRKWKWQCLKVKVIIIESESNCSPMAPAIHYIFGLIRLKAILFSVNLIHFCISFMIFSWYYRSPCLPPCIHTSLLSSCSRGIWRSPGKKDSKTFLLFWWIRSFQVWSYWFQIQNALAFTFPILNEMCVNINHSSNSRSLAADSLILPFIW